MLPPYDSPAFAPPPSTRERLRRGLYAGHLLTAWALGISNALLGLALVLAPLLGPFRKLRDPLARRLLVCAGLYLLLLCGAIAASRDVRTSLRAVSEVTSFATLALALVWLRGERRVRALVDALVLVGTAVAISGLFQVLLGYGGIDRRIRGPFSHYMTFAGTLLLLDLVLVARLLLRRERQPRTRTDGVARPARRRLERPRHPQPGARGQPDAQRLARSRGGAGGDRGGGARRSCSWARSRWRRCSSSSRRCR